MSFWVLQSFRLFCFRPSNDGARKLPNVSSGYPSGNAHAHSKNLTGLGSDVAGGGVREQGSHFPSRGSVEQTPQDSLCLLSVCSSGR